MDASWPAVGRNTHSEVAKACLDIRRESPSLDCPRIEALKGVWILKASRSRRAPTEPLADGLRWHSRAGPATRTGEKSGRRPSRATVVVRARAAARLRAAGFGTYPPATRSAGIVPEYPHAQVSPAGGTSDAGQRARCCAGPGLVQIRRSSSRRRGPTEKIDGPNVVHERWPCRHEPVFHTRPFLRNGQTVQSVSL